MAEKAPRTTPTPAETSAANAPSDGFFGNAEDLQSRIDEQNAEAYRAQLRDEALAGLDEYLSENPDVSREDALNQIVQDLEAYDKKLAGMDQQGDTYGTLEDTIDKTDAGERLDGIDRLIQSDARLRRMNMMAQDIANLRVGEITPEVQQAIQDKEDKLNELLETYANTDNADETVIDRIIDRTATEAGVNTTEDTGEEQSTQSLRTLKRNENGVPLPGQARNTYDTPQTNDGSNESQVDQDSATPENEQSPVDKIFREAMDEVAAEEKKKPVDDTEKAARKAMEEVGMEEPSGEQLPKPTDEEVAEAEKNSKRSIFAKLASSKMVKKVKSFYLRYAGYMQLDDEEKQRRADRRRGKRAEEAAAERAQNA